MAFSLDDGKLLWDISIPFTAPTGTALPSDITSDTGFAASTPAADKNGVYAIFATADVVALSPDGTIRWQKNLGVPDISYGYASSLLVYQNILYVQFDNYDKSALYAFRTEDGSQLWKDDRHVKASWASPTIIIPPESQPQLVLTAPDYFCAYNPRTGRLLWSVEGVSGEVAPSPAYADTKLFIAQEYSKLICFQWQPKGDPTVLWEYKDDLPDIASPVASAKIVWLATSGGILVALDTDTGKLLYEHDYPKGINASPLLLHDTLVVLTLDGTLHFLDATTDSGLERGKLSTSERIHATPFFTSDSIILRGDKMLMRVK